MKKGINIWSFKSGMNVVECMDMAKDAGFDGIELALNETGQVSLQSSDKDILDIKRIAEDKGLDIPSFATGLYWSYSPTSMKKEIRDKAKAIVRRQLEIASLLGADTILVVPGAVGVDFIPDCEIVEYDVAYEYALQMFTELKKDAQEIGVNIGLENVWNKFLLSPIEMRDFIDKIGSPYVGAYFDVGNVIYTGYPEQWIKILGKRIKKVHFKDFRASVGNINGFVDLLAGDVNFPAVMEAFRHVGYDDYITAEMGSYKHHGEQIIYNTSNAMDKILGR